MYYSIRTVILLTWFIFKTLMIQMTNVTLTVTTRSSTNSIVYRHRFLQPYSPERSPDCASFSCGSSILQTRELQLRTTIIVTIVFLTNYFRKSKSVPLVAPKSGTAQSANVWPHNKFRRFCTTIFLYFTTSRACFLIYINTII